MADEISNSAATAASTSPAALAVDVAVTSAPATAAEPVAASVDSSAPAKAFEMPATVLGSEPTPEIKTEAPVTDATPPADKPVEAKAPEVAKPEGDKPVEAPKDLGDKSAEPAPLPVFEPWVLPEGAKLDEGKTAEFNSLLGEFQNASKAEQALVQKFGQTLVDKHTAALTETVGRLHEAYQQSWVKQTEDWKQAFISDPEIGGKRQATTVKQANEFISTHGGTPEQQTEFRNLMQTTGIGNHPAMIRMFANAMSRFSEGKPLPANPPVSAPSKTQRMYGKKTG